MVAEGGGARRILYVCDFNAHGGTQTHLMHLMASLDRKRFVPWLAALTLHPDLKARLEKLDVEVTDLGLRGALRPATLAAAVRLARAAGGRVTLLHGFLFQGNLLTAAVSLLSRVACVTSVRNLDAWKRRRHRLVSSLAHGRALRVVFNSRAVRDATVVLEGIPPAKAVVIRNGVEDMAGRVQVMARSDDDARPTAICVASLRDKKGHRHLLEGFRMALRAVPSARLLLVGEGPLRGELEAAVQEKGLDRSVSFLGYTADVAAQLARSDLLVLSSLEEGMPNALLEAMSAGLPAVVTSVGGCPEAVEEGVTGFLVPPADPAALGARMAALLSDHALRRRQGAAARRRFESEHTIPRMVAAYEDLYDELLGAAPS